MLKTTHYGIDYAKVADNGQMWEVPKDLAKSVDKLNNELERLKSKNLENRYLEDGRPGHYDPDGNEVPTRLSTDYEKAMTGRDRMPKDSTPYHE